MAVGQNQWYHFGVGEFTTHFRTYFGGDWDVHWGYGIFTHGHMPTFWNFALGKTNSKLLSRGCLEEDAVSGPQAGAPLGNVVFDTFRVFAGSLRAFLFPLPHPGLFGGVSQTPPAVPGLCEQALCSTLSLVL